MHERAIGMGIASGFTKLNEGPADGLVSALDLFPWWMLHLLDPDRYDSGLGNLPRLLVDECLGCRRKMTRRERALQIYDCAVPLGTRTDVERALLRVIQRRRERVSSKGNDSATALRALAHLAQTGGVASPEASFAPAAHSLVAGEPGFPPTLRLLGLLIAQHGFQELAVCLPRCAASGDPGLGLELPGYLACLGKAGRAQSEALMSEATEGNRTPVRAALDAWQEHDFDGLDPFLNHQDWRLRCATARLLAHFARVNHAPEAVLEMLLARSRVEEDSDTQSVLAQGLGETIRQVGPSAAEPVLALLGERNGSDSNAFLLDGLLFGQPARMEGARLERLRGAGGSQGWHQAAEAQALNRLLAWQTGVPVSVADWIQPPVIRVLQWQTAELPPSVSSWFATSTTVEAHQLTACLMRETHAPTDGYLAAQYLKHHPEVTGIWEALCIQALNLGRSEVWELLAAVLAGSRHPVSLHPAELRCALGFRAGLPLGGDWAGVGRLLTVAGSRLEQAREALCLLAVHSPEVRELTRHSLASLAANPGASETGSALPPVGAFGPDKLDPAMLGGSPLKLVFPQELPLEFQPLFGLIPPAWENCGPSLRGLEVSALHQIDWSGKLANWSNPQAVANILTGQSIEQIQRAILATAMSADADLNCLAKRLAMAVPDGVLEGALGRIVAVIRKRQLQTGIGPVAAPGGSSPPEGEDENSDEDDKAELVGELEELVSQL